MRERRPGPGSAPAAVLPAVLAVLLALVLSACGGTATRTAPKSVAPTPISRLNADALRLARVDFCSLVPAAAVRAALGGDEVTQKTSWRNGDPAQVDADVTDVVDEFGCGWTSGDHAASAWIFARPVTAADARAVIAKTSRRPGCTSTRRRDFGAPSQQQRCRLPDGSHRVRLAGLFADTWLTCQVTGPAEESNGALTRRAGAWCVQVANATNTAR